MDDKPSQALRHGRWKSSMWLAIDAVKKGEADVAVSAGNTGALMAMAQILPADHGGHRAPGDRGVWPTLRGEIVVLDVGASIGADAEHLVDLAVMGARHGARRCSTSSGRRVGLLNIGVEEVKGLEEVREAGRHPARGGLPDLDYRRLRRRRRHRQGHGRRGRHRGLCRQHRAQDRRGHRAADRRISARRDEPHAGARGSAICSRAGASQALRDKMDPRKANGGVFLGLNGIVIKSHGGTDAEGFAAASISATTWSATNC